MPSIGAPWTLPPIPTLTGGSADQPQHQKPFTMQLSFPVAKEVMRMLDVCCRLSRNTTCPTPAMGIGIDG